ncbi:hypothetical protein BC833DRAFT_588663 [Globomyces pollinis-pini]|nr:hypothetical protein BC833DRAFT_588663 [Globomyces pollinis-pini]
MKLQSEMDFLELEGNAACNSILNNLNHHMGNQNTTHQNEIVNETRPDVIVDNLNSGLTFSADDDAMFSFDERPRIVSKYTTDEIEFDKIDVKAEKGIQ